MKKKNILMIIISLLLLVQPLLKTDANNIPTNQFVVNDSTAISKESSVKQAIGIGGEEQIKTNFNPNYGFEYEDYNEGPDDYNYYTSAFQYTDEVYTGITHSGTYACRIYGQGSSQSWSNPYLYRSIDSVPHAEIDEIIEMNFWYYLIGNPDIAIGAAIYMRLNFYTPSGSRNIYYYFSSSSVPGNSSSSAYYDLTGSSPFSTWINFQRDITADFNAAFIGGDPSIYLRYMYFYGSSPDDATGLVQWVVDDVSVTNAVAYEWIVDNAGFENGDGSYWSSYNRGTGSVFLTENDQTEGLKAANLTSYSNIDGIQADTNIYSDIGDWDDPPKGLYANNPGDVVITFDWKYNDYNPDTNNYAFFYIYGYNGSFEFNFYFYLGDETDIVPNYNGTSSSYTALYYAAPGFGSRDVWNTFSIDIYDYLAYSNITNMPIMDCTFSVYSGYSAGSRTELLLDNFSIIADPLGDPGFEEDWYYTYSNPIPSWEVNTNENYISFTHVSHSGDNAANISSYLSAGQVRLYRDTYIPVEDNLYSDLWWNLDALDFDSNSYAQIYFELDNSYYLNYLFAAGNSYSTVNTSNSYYYYAENYNELDTWNLFERNIAEDALISFGADNWNITEVRFIVYGSAVEMNSLLVDDVHFVRDTHGPQLVIQNLINTPTYYQNALLEIMAYDYFSHVSYVQVFYRTDGGWSSVVASMAGMSFLASIPAHDWDNTVQYYIVMQDTFGLQSTADNSGLYYSYDIVDNVEPYVQILHVTTSSKGIQSVDIEAYDPGSDIAYVELYDTGELVANLTTTPYNVTYSEDFEQIDGTRTLIARAVDNAGNEMIHEVVLGVDLPSAFVAFFQTWGTLFGAGVVGVAWGVVAIVQAVKKSKT